MENSLESWIWSAACFIRWARGEPKYKDYILPLIVTKPQTGKVLLVNVSQIFEQGDPTNFLPPESIAHNADRAA